MIKTNQIKQILTSGALAVTLFSALITLMLPSQAAVVTAGPGQSAESQTRRSVMLGKSSGTTNNPLNYYNWSGYAATTSNSFYSVETTYVQPAVTCPAPGAWTLFWVGFDGLQSSNVEQAGTAAQCDSSAHPQPVYYAFWEMYPTNNIQTQAITIHPGDTIHAQVDYTSNGTYSLSVTDKTNKQHFTQIATCGVGVNCGRQSAEWIVERPYINGGYAPLANWGSLTMSSNKAADSLKPSGKPTLKPISAFNNYPVNMTNYPSQVRNLTAVNAKGNSFTDTWLAAQ